MTLRFAAPPQVASPVHPFIGSGPHQGFDEVAGVRYAPGSKSCSVQSGSLPLATVAARRLLLGRNARAIDP
jgi:hypothetical protein